MRCDLNTRTKIYLYPVECLLFAKKIFSSCLHCLKLVPVTAVWLSMFICDYVVKVSPDLYQIQTELKCYSY